MIDDSRVDELLSAAATHDGTAALSEQFVLGLRDERLGHRHFMREENGELTGLLALDGQTAEMVVRPAWRRQGIGSALLADAATQAPDLKVWAHGNVAAAQAFAANHGLELGRKLLVMEVMGDKLHAAAGSKPVAPAGYAVVNYAESVAKWSQQDVDAAWLAANNEAFSWHPEQGGWDLERLHRGMEATWFDPADVLLLWDDTGADTDGCPPLAGFHWTKWHTEQTPAFGEIYVVGLANDYRGKQLGTPLLQAGLQRLEEKGAQRVILYVESDNAPAVAAYERLGFGVAEEHAVYQK